MYSLGYNTVIAVFTVELTHGKWRTLLGHCLCEIGWSIGHASMGGLVAGVRDMSTLEMVIALSGAPFMLLWYFMPESPRWLLAKGRKDKVMSTTLSNTVKCQAVGFVMSSFFLSIEITTLNLSHISPKAKLILTTACKMNKKSLKDLDHFIEAYEVPKKSERHATIIDLFRFRGICRNQLILNACWLSFSMGYFGLAYNTPANSMNPFLVFSLPGIVGCVMGFVAPFMENGCVRIQK